LKYFLNPRFIGKSYPQRDETVGKTAHDLSSQEVLLKKRAAI